MLPSNYNNDNRLTNNIISSNSRKNTQKIGGLRTLGFHKFSKNNKPLISIITVVYNGGDHLPHAIQSVQNQTYDNIEHIIIDGASTDNTLAILKRYN